jgi:hypothetical protein
LTVTGEDSLRRSLSTVKAPIFFVNSVRDDRVLTAYR